MPTAVLLENGDELTRLNSDNKFVAVKALTGHMANIENILSRSWRVAQSLSNPTEVVPIHGMVRRRNLESEQTADRVAAPIAKMSMSLQPVWDLTNSLLFPAFPGRKHPNPLAMVVAKHIFLPSDRTRGESTTRVLDIDSLKVMGVNPKVSLQ